MALTALQYQLPLLSVHPAFDCADAYAASSAAADEKSLMAIDVISVLPEVLVVFV